MKKIFPALILAAALTFSSAIVTGAAATENEERSIPKAAVAPTIDGVITDDEWDNALAIKVNADTTNAVAGSLDTCPDATYYWMWDDAGIYFFGDVKDETEKQLDYDIMCYVAIGIAIQQYPAESKHDEHRPQTVKPQPGYFHVFGRSIVCITPLPV